MTTTPTVIMSLFIKEWQLTLRNFSMASLATSKRVGRAPRYVLWDMEALVSTRKRMMVIFKQKYFY